MANPQADYLRFLIGQGLLPGSSGGPSTSLAAPAPYTRHGDTNGSVNSQAGSLAQGPIYNDGVRTPSNVGPDSRRLYGTPGYITPPGWDVPVTQKQNNDPLGRTFSPRLPGSQTDPMLELLERWLASKFSRTSGVL
jgi:hypothetical protein